jgi:hypothetical protein
MSYSRQTKDDHSSSQTRRPFIPARRPAHSGAEQLCLLVTKAGKRHLVEKVAGEPAWPTGQGTESSVCLQRPVVGPRMSKAIKTVLIDVLREIVEEK